MPLAARILHAFGLDRAKSRKPIGEQMSADNRTLANVIRQYQQLEAIKNRLVRSGVLNADASVEEVEAALRKMIPADLFAKG